MQLEIFFLEIQTSRAHLKTKFTVFVRNYLMTMFAAYKTQTALQFKIIY